MADEKTLRLVSRDDGVQEQIIEVLENALKRARAGEFADVVVVATIRETNTYYTHWSRSMDTARRMGLMHMALWDIQHSWSH
jgi:broad specificity polyphosphatase/5'/3'-nucleotidase SurE